MDTIWSGDALSGEGPKYQQLGEAIRAKVHDGSLQSGARLPAVRDMAWQLGVTPGTVARAYRGLIDAGILEAGVGRGTFVAGRAQPRRVLPDEPLINAPVPDDVDFRGCRVADVGQGALIADALGRLAGAGAGYIDYPTSDTDVATRAAVAQWVGDALEAPIGADDIVLGLGAQNSIIMALQTVLNGPRPVILTEELTYPGVRHAARLLRAELVGVEMDAHGLRPDRLEEAARRHGAQVLLTSAELHSPTTIHTPPERKAELARIARTWQLQVIEDDCHRIGTSRAPTYRDLCPERGWYVSSLSKSFSSSLRFGYTVCPVGMSEQARQVAQSSFYGLAQPIVDVAGDLLRSGAAADVRNKVLRINRAQVRKALNVLGQWEVAWHEDAPFIWLPLPTGWRGSTFASACAARLIRIKPADEFALPDGAAPHAVRLALNSMNGPARFQAALEQMADLLARRPMGVDI
ncbi:MAG: GntR family transcriptional regulator [Confluentimicrobium sp.]|nr:GntR family transcriptional regulator [Actibacterium sp.]